MAPDNNRPNGAWTIIIPVKETTTAKTRLRGLSQPVRATLALAFAMDTASAALACPSVRSVLVVTNDGLAARSLGELGARIVGDAPSAGLNAALDHGAATVRREDPRAAVAAMPADLPALRSAELEEAFAAGSAHERWFVPDADGSGTALLAASARTPLEPLFGVLSRDAHLRSGAFDVSAQGRLGRVGLRRDVDTEEHLAEAVGLGVGRFTRQALADLALTSSQWA